MATKRKTTIKQETPKQNPQFAFNDKRWGKDVSTAMSRIKSQASNRKLPITLPKINLPD